MSLCDTLNVRHCPDLLEADIGNQFISEYCTASGPERTRSPRKKRRKKERCIESFVEPSTRRLCGEPPVYIETKSTYAHVLVSFLATHVAGEKVCLRDTPVANQVRSGRPK